MPGPKLISLSKYSLQHWHHRRVPGQWQPGGIPHLFRASTLHPYRRARHDNNNNNYILPLLVQAINYVWLYRANAKISCNLPIMHAHNIRGWNYITYITGHYCRPGSHVYISSIHKQSKSKITIFISILSQCVSRGTKKQLETDLLGNFSQCQTTSKCDTANIKTFRGESALIVFIKNFLLIVSLKDFRISISIKKKIQARVWRDFFD